MVTVFARAYELTFEERRGYLYALITALHVTPGMAYDYLDEIADKIADVDCQRLLIERDVPAMPAGHALVAIHQFVGMRDGRPLAFVNRHAAYGPELKKQIDAGATLGAHVAYFDNDADAEKWLLAN